MEIRALEATELTTVASVVAAQQDDPTRHIGYLGTSATGIEEQLTELEPAGLGGAVVAVEGAEVVGMLAAEWDDDPPRVWWHGPVVAAGHDWQATALKLDAAARRLLPATVVEEEYAPDSRHDELPTFAAALGFRAQEGSVVLSRTLPASIPDHHPADVLLRPFAARDRAAVAALHDRLFPATHTTGTRIDEGRDRSVLVATVGERLVGYVAAERQEGGEGYVDFLGVEADQRGRGLGRVLVATACARLHEQFGCVQVHLTVRASNAAARAVYAACGFTEERVLVPWRRGFSIA
jgi:ribosomal protein S18 acetylase RimI-like enzyme